MEDIVPGEISQTENDKYRLYYHLYLKSGGEGERQIHSKEQTDACQGTVGDAKRSW